MTIQLRMDFELLRYFLPLLAQRRKVDTEPSLPEDVMYQRERAMSGHKCKKEKYNEDKGRKKMKDKSERITFSRYKQ